MDLQLKRRFNVFSEVLTICLAEVNKYIVSGHANHAVCIWDMNTGALIKQLDGHKDVVAAVCVTPANRHIISGSHDESIHIWHMESGECVRQLKGQTDIYALCIT